MEWMTQEVDDMMKLKNQYWQKDFQTYKTVNNSIRRKYDIQSVRLIDNH